MEYFQKVVHAKTEEAYELALGQFEAISQPFDNFVAYVQKTWTDPHKERFVEAWINRYIHLGNTTTNRVESAHSALNVLHDSRGDMCRCWDSVNDMLKTQHGELKRHFEMIKQKARELAFPDTTSMCPPPERVPTKGSPRKDKGKKSDEFSTKRDPSLWEHVDNFFDSQQDSTSAAAQSRKWPTPSVSNSSTAVQSRSSTPSTFPVPKSGAPTPPLPKKFDPNPSQIEKPTQTGSNLALSQIQGLTLNPTPPIIRSDAYNQFISYMPKEMHRFVDDIVDVQGDGNCGFRCFATLLGRGEDDFWSVRNELFEELQENIDLYTKLFDGISSVDYVMKALKKQHMEVIGSENWMTVPECAYLAANKYKATIVCWYNALPFSVYPFLIAPIKNAPVFHILFTGNHFVTPVRKRGSPMPGTITYWTNWKKDIAKDWPKQFTECLQQYKALNPYSHVPHVVDLSKD